MNIKVIAVLVAVLILLGAGGFLVLNKNKTSTPATVTASATPTPTPKAQTTGSIKDLLTGGKNQTCTINYPDGNGSGTVFLSGKKMRGDFGITTGGKVVESHILNDGSGYAYYWSSSSTTGMKMKFDINAAIASPQAGVKTTTTPVNLDTKVDYKCSNWTVDNSKFTVPSGITFTDYSALMGSGVPATSCATCNSLTGSSKTACMTALHCQ